MPRGLGQIARRVAKFMTPVSIRLIRSGQRIGKRVLERGGSLELATKRGGTFGQRVSALPASKRSRLIKRSAALGGLVVYGGYRLRTRKRK